MIVSKGMIVFAVLFKIFTLHPATSNIPPHINLTQSGAGKNQQQAIACTTLYNFRDPLGTGVSDVLSSPAFQCFTIY